MRKASASFLAAFKKTLCPCIPCYVPSVNTPVSIKSTNESQVASVSDGSGGTIIAWAEYIGVPGSTISRTAYNNVVAVVRV